MDDHSQPLEPHTYVRLTLSQLWENLPILLLASLIFSLLWMPSFLLLTLGLWGFALITGVTLVAPGWAALLALQVALTGGDKAPIGIMLRAFPRFWKRSATMGFLTVLPLLAAWLTLPLFAQPQELWIAWLGLAADLAGFLILVTLGLYAFPLLVWHDLSVRIALRNALILASRHIVNTLGLLAMGVLFAFAIAYISPGLLFVLPTVWGLFMVNHCRMVIKHDARQTTDKGFRR
ncbi:MAG: hypothetical protein RML36_00455 [Anaerolineae bacterium]|nr:hypothetical protein [Anaerolineae bacterium]